MVVKHGDESHVVESIEKKNAVEANPRQTSSRFPRVFLQKKP